MVSDGASNEPTEIVIGRAGRRPVASTGPGSESASASASAPASGSGLGSAQVTSSGPVTPSGSVPASAPVTPSAPVTASGPATVSTPWAIGSLVAVNLVPLAGVLFLGWSTFDLMLLYWFENGIVGLFALLKILLTRGRDGDAEGASAAFERLFLAGFFVLHYGAFWTVHGFFVVALFGGGAATGGAFAPMSGPLWFFFGGLGIAGAALHGGLLLTAMGLLVSHAVSFIGNVLVRGEDLDRPPKALMAQPYGRVVVLHVTLVLGAGLMLGLGEPAIGLALFVLLKTIVDLGAHLRSHRPRPAA